MKSAITPALQSVAGINFDGNQANTLRYAEALMGLDAAQQKVVMSASGLSAVQQKQVVDTMAGIAAAKQYTVAQLEEALGLDAGAISSKLNATATSMMTEELLRAAVANGSLTVEQLQAIASTNAETAAIFAEVGAMKTLNASMKASTIGMLKNPMGWISIAIGMIPFLIQGISSLIVTQEEAYEEAEKLRSKYEETKSELEGLRTEVNENKDRIFELQQLSANGTITLIEQEELERLRQTNAELETTIALEKEQAAIESKKSNEEFVKAFSKGSFRSTLGQVFRTELDTLKHQYGDMITAYNAATAEKGKAGLVGWAENDINEVEKVIERINYLEKSIFSNYDVVSGRFLFNNVDYEAHVKELTDTYRELSELQASGETLSDSQATLLENTRIELVALANELKHDYLDKYIGEDENTQLWSGLLDSIKRLITPAEYLSEKLAGLPNECYESLVKLGNASELTADNVNDLADKFPALETLLGETGYGAEDVAKHFNKLTSSAQDGGAATKTYQAELQDLSDVLSDLNSAYDLASKAKEDMEDGGGLSADTIKSLAGAEENYLDYLYEENGVVKLNTELWKENADAKMQHEMDEIQKEIDSLRERNTILRESLESYTELEHSAHGGYFDPSLINDYVGEIEANNAAIDENQKKLAMYEALFQRITNGVDEATESLAESQQRLKLHKLVKELRAVTDGTTKYNDVTKKVVQSIRDEINATNLKIRAYQSLENQLLGTSNAFTRFEEAQEVDSARDHTDDFTKMLTSLLSSYEETTYGTEAFWTAFRDLIPTDIYAKFTEAGDQIAAGWEYISEQISPYFTKVNDSISITRENVSNFVSAGLNTALSDGSTVFQGTLDSFNLNPQIQSLDAFAKAMGITTTSAFALLGALDQYDQNQFGFLDSMVPDTLEGEILRCDNAMANLLQTQQELGEAGEVGTEQWNDTKDAIKAVEKEYTRLGKAARQKFVQNIDLDDQIVALQEALEKAEQADVNGFWFDDAFVGIDEAEDRLNRLIQAKYDLGEPTELEIQIAMESVQSEIDELRGKIAEVGDDTSALIHFGEVDLSVDEAKEELEKLQEEKAKIIVYADLDDEDVTNSLEVVQEYKILDKTFTISMNGYRSTMDRLESLNKLITEINGIKVDTKVSAAKLRQLRSASNMAAAEGTPGAEHAEHDALVGELGKELLVDPHHGVWRVVGSDGAEMIDIPKDAIIFNHEQTKELLRNRRTNSRGTALAEGNAYDAGPLFSGSLGESRTLEKLEETGSDVSEQLGETSDQLEQMRERLSELQEVGEHQIYLMEKNMEYGDGGTQDRLSSISDYASSAIAIYRELQAEAHALAEEYRAIGEEESSEYIRDLQKVWWEYEDQIRSLKRQIVDDIKDIVESASDAVDELQNVYDTLHDAAAEYAESGGYLSVDTFQKINELGVEYLSYLRDENGLLVINEERLNHIIAAKTQELAIDSALAYIERIRLALSGESEESLQKLLYATEQTTSATWDLVYAQLSALGLSNDEYQAALNNINALRSLADNAIQGIGRIAADTREELQDMKQGLDDILQYTINMLKQRINDQIQALRDMKDAYSDIIDMKKKSLELSKQEADRQKTMAAKMREMAKLQARIDALSLDDSRSAQAERAKLLEEMAKLQEDLADDQAEYTLDAQKDALDEMEQAYHAEKDSEIEVLENSISSYQKLYDMAISYIESHWNTLLSELTAWNTEYGNSLNSEISSAWDSALAAAQRYGSFVSALNSIDADIEAAGNSGGSVVVGATNNYGESANAAEIRNLVNQMKANSAAWHTADEQERQRLNEENKRIAYQELPKYGLRPYYDAASGVWYVSESDRRKLYDVYHKGGIVGGGSIKDNEQFALLKDREWVLSEQMVHNLSTQMQRLKALQESFRDMPDYISKSALADALRIDGAGTVNNVTNNSNQPIQIEIGETNIYGANGDTVQQHISVTREMVNDIARMLRIGM